MLVRDRSNSQFYVHTGKEKSHALILSRAQPDGKLWYDINTVTEMNRILNSNIGEATQYCKENWSRSPHRSWKNEEERKVPGE